MGGNRKHGFARGNANGRNGQTYGPKRFCGGCQREHGGKLYSTVIYGVWYCDRQASRIETARSERRLNAILAFGSPPEESGEELTRFAI